MHYYAQFRAKLQLFFHIRKRARIFILKKCHYARKMTYFVCKRLVV